MLITGAEGAARAHGGGGGGGARAWSDSDIELRAIMRMIMSPC